MNTDIVTKLKLLYAAPSPRRDIRERTLQPFIEQARTLRNAFDEIRAQYDDAANEAASIDTRALARYLEPALVPVVGRLREAALVLKGVGNADELVEAIYVAKGKVDTINDAEWEAAIQVVDKYVKLLTGAVQALRSSAAVLDSAITVLATSERLASDIVNVPKREDHGFFSDGQTTTNQPANTAAKPSVQGR